MDSWLSPAHKPIWFAAFFQHPLVYHALSFSCGVMQDVSNNRPVGEQRLLHHIKTIQLVNKQLDNLESVDVEPILLAIITLWRVNCDEIIVPQVVPLLFKAHHRSQKWVLLAGKLGGVGSHAFALQYLVQRNGGLKNFKTLPSLQESIAIADMLDSSSHATKPRFESIWKSQLLLKVLKTPLEALSIDREGESFAEAVPGGLPREVLRSLQQIASLDKLLDDFAARQVSTQEEMAVAELGSAAQHELLSIPPWDKLTHIEREGSFRASYEACRIVSLIYSISIILPMKASDPWLGKLLKQLRKLLETSLMDMRFQGSLALLIWTVYIGGMAAFWTSHRSFFVNSLRTALHTTSRTSWCNVKPLLEGFLWRDNACSDGAAVLWEALQFNDPEAG